MAVVKEADFHKKDRTGLISRAEVVGEITSTMADDYCSYVGNELYCRSCGCECRTVHREYECPRCGSEDVFNSKFIPCDCGATVYLEGFTNECPQCKKLYNGFGEELAPIEEWDEEERFACYCPGAESDGEYI